MLNSLLSAMNTNVIWSILLIFLFKKTDAWTSMRGEIHAASLTIEQPLVGTSLAVIIENLGTSITDIHSLHLNNNRKSFPITFYFQKLDKIKKTGFYLIFVLIFGNPHRLLYESAQTGRQLKFNETNHFNFTVNYVCKC